jgi:hypothetical protein
VQNRRMLYENSCTLKMEAAGSSDTFEMIYQTIRCHMVTAERNSKCHVTESGLHVMPLAVSARQFTQQFRRPAACMLPAFHQGGCGSMPGLSMCDSSGKSVHSGRFTPSTSVSPAYSQSLINYRATQTVSFYFSFSFLGWG